MSSSYVRYVLHGNGKTAFGQNFGRFEDAWNYAKKEVESRALQGCDQWDMLHTNAKDCFIDFTESEQGVWYMRYARCNIKGMERDYLMIVRHLFSAEDHYESDFEMYEKHWLEREDRLEREDEAKMNARLGAEMNK